MMDLQSDFGGLLGSLKRVCDTGVSIVKNRVELATLEMKEEKSRLVSVAIWGGIFLVSTVMAIIAVGTTLLFVFWEQRLYVAMGLLAFCVIAALVSFFFVKGRLKALKPFAETIAQLKKDGAWLHQN